MSNPSLDLKASVLQRVEQDAPRKIWTPADFLDLGSRDAVDKVLQRLTTAGRLRRIDRGLYDQPGFNTLTQKPNPPDPRSVIEALSRRDQVRMLVDGLTAANDLGLTDAVPAKIIVHSDARRRALRLGNVTISFLPTAASKLFWAGRPAMRVVQALHWMRDMLARQGESDRVQRKLRRFLDDPVTGPPLKSDLLDGMKTLPTWMQIFLKMVIDGDNVMPTKPATDGGQHDDVDHPLDPRPAALLRNANRPRRRAGAANEPALAPRAPRERSKI